MIVRTYINGHRRWKPLRAVRKQINGWVEIFFVRYRSQMSNIFCERVTLNRLSNGDKRLGAGVYN